MLLELSCEELADGLDRVVAEVLAESDVASPPVDAMVVARRLGIALAWDDAQEGRARYVRFGRRGSHSGAAILLRPEPRFERRQWAVAHEIGEHVAYRAFAVWGVDPRETAPDAREKTANWLAGRLLLPARWFEEDARACGWDLLTLKERFATASHELIARRMLECRPAVVISVFDQRRLSFRRSNVVGQVPPPSPGEIDCWNEVHETGRPLQNDRRPPVVQGWPVHEDGWKREILRMVVEE